MVEDALLETGRMDDAALRVVSERTARAADLNVAGEDLLLQSLEAAF